MKKYILISPVALLVLWAGITWIIGSQTKSGFNAAVETINDSLGAASAFTSVTEESYSRGFLSSEATTKVTVADKPDKENSEVFLKFKAWHGPLMMTPAGFKIGAEYVIVTLDNDRLPEEIRKIVEDGFKGAEPATLGVFTGFGGKVAVDATISPFSSTGTGVDSVKFDGFSGELETNVSSSYARGKINIGALTIEDKKNGKLLSTAEAKGEMDYTNVIMRVAGDGSSHMDFPEIKMTNGGDSFALKDLHFDNVSKQNEGKLDMTTKMSIGGFKGPAKGPYADLITKLDGKLEIEFIADGMDVETLQSMAEAQQKMEKAQGDKGDDSVPSEQALQDYLVAASSLLQPGYKMKNHIAFSNKGGESKIGLGIEYTGEKPLLELDTVRQLVDSLEVALNLQIIKDLIPAAMTETIVQPSIAMGFILDEGKAYKGDAILGSGELTVNGKATPVLEKMGPLLDIPIPWENFGVSKDK